MVAAGSQSLHLYPGHFLTSGLSPVPSSFSVMRKSRRRGASRSASYLPVVVLNSQDSGQQPQLRQEQQYTQADRSSRWPGAFDLPDLPDLSSVFGSGSEPANSRIGGSQSLSGSYSGGGGGCGGGGDSTGTLVFLAALAASVFFLNQAIIMNIGRRKRGMDGQGGLAVLVREGEIVCIT